MTVSIYVAPCNLGQGLFASRDLKKGEEFLQFSGPVISLATAIDKGDEQANPLQIGEEDYLDIEPPGVYANHSCRPNAGVIKDRVLVALQDIRSDEEICYDYSTTMWEGIWTMRCRCGAENCRGLIGDFPQLPIDLQASYLQLGVVQAFIVRRLQLERG